VADKPTKVPPRKAAAARTKAATRPPVPTRKRPGKRSRRRSVRPYVYSGAFIAVVALIAVLVITNSGGSSTAVKTHQAAINWRTPAGVKAYGGLGPEGVPIEVGPQLASPNAGLTGATVDGIQCAPVEQLAYHHHVHLAIFVDGKPYSVPIGEGMVPPVEISNTSSGQFAQGSQTCLYWMHVHAQDGVVHIESPYTQNFVLGQVMDIWHVPLTATQLGQFKGNVTVTDNGSPVTGDLLQIPLKEHDQLVINVGTPVVTPPPISWSGTSL
jgi:hypothetical protein